MQLNPTQANDIAARLQLSQQATRELAGRAQAGAVDLSFVKDLAARDGKAALFDQCQAEFSRVLGDAPTRKAHAGNAPVTGAFAALVSQKGDVGGARERLLGAVVKNFDRLAYANDSTALFGIEDVNRILQAPRGVFKDDLVKLAKDVMAHPDILSLADWTHPSSGLHVHDRTNVKEEYGRALTLVQQRKPVTRALDHLLQHFPADVALSRADVAREAARLATGGEAEQAIGKTLTMVLDGKLSPFPAPCDLTSVLANASGNNGGIDNQLITREGIRRVKTLINGGDLSVKQREGQMGSRTELIDRVLKHYDALLAATPATYLSHKHLDTILQNPSAFAPAVVQTARDLKKNADLMALADSIETPTVQGQGTLDRQTERLQYQLVGELLWKSKILTQALDQLIDRYPELQKQSPISTLTPEVLKQEIARLRATGDEGDRYRADALSLPLIGERYGHPVTFTEVLENWSGNNASGQPRAITYESLHELRKLLNAPMQGTRAKEVRVHLGDFGDGSKVQLNGTAQLKNWLDYGDQQSPAIYGPDKRNKVRLTNDFGQAGSVLLKDALPLGEGDCKTSFNVFFQFQAHNNKGGDGDGPGADGITFVLADTPKALGGGGGGLGVIGVNNSVAIEFDTYNNSADFGGESGNHVALVINGDVTNTVKVDVPGRLNDGYVWAAWVDYDAETQKMELRLQRANPAKPFSKPEATTLVAEVDLAKVVGKQAHVGFTGGTGAASAMQDVFGVTINARVPLAD